MIGVGSKVVCIKNCDGLTYRTQKVNANHPNGYPAKGQIYVVESIFIDRFGELALRLIGKPVHCFDGTMGGWHHEKFRELAEHRMQQELEYLRSLPVPVEPRVWLHEPVAKESQK